MWPNNLQIQKGIPNRQSSFFPYPIFIRFAPFNNGYPNGLVWLWLLKFTVSCLTDNLLITLNLTTPLVHVQCISLGSIVIYYLYLNCELQIVYDNRTQIVSNFLQLHVLIVPPVFSYWSNLHIIDLYLLHLLD